MTLMLVSHKHMHRVLGSIFDRSIETINRNIKKVLRGLCLFAAEIIRLGDQTTVNPRIANSTIFYPWFKDAAGAMDGTHISACPPTGEQMAYTNRHRFQSQNVLAVCDHDMRFIYVYAGWEESTHDAQVLESALAYPSDFSLPQPGNYYLVDAAYRNVLGFMPPMHQPEDDHFQRFEAEDVHLNEEPEVGGPVPQPFALNVSLAELAE
ncbi:uncharacterized protein [Coffea arabica]|uniref:DDE Tnp4 domain-containing protein n=1 Tax=Coffea arabica TaxID=13443 RepID=A0ABM4UE73_COFAR